MKNVKFHAGKFSLGMWLQGVLCSPWSTSPGCCLPCTNHSSQNISQHPESQNRWKPLHCGSHCPSMDAQEPAGRGKSHNPSVTPGARCPHGPGRAEGKLGAPWREQDPSPTAQSAWVQELVARVSTVVFSLAGEPSRSQVRLLTSLSNFPTLPVPKTE